MPFLKKLRKLISSPWLEKLQSVTEFYWTLKTRLYYRFFFQCIGRKSKLIAPLRLRNVHNIRIGDNVLINRLGFLLTLQQPGSEVPVLSIGDGSVIGHMNHITSIREVRIGNKVLTADRVYISDHSHGFSNISMPIMDQPVESKAPVRIGDGTWIGENAVILCCTIGKNCVIGSNAVVISDIPDYSVAVGSPARVVRKFNPASNSWEKVPH